VHFKVELGGRLHELSMKEGDNRNPADALHSISGAERVSIPQGKVALNWEGKTFKARESGAECRIPFYLKLQTGENEFETIKAYIRQGESIGLARKIAIWRFGIQDCLILGASQTASESWREKTFTVQCKMLAGDPNHFAN
jgi:hypothetical protein